MLRSEFLFAIEGWPRRMLALLLGEAFLGFLAIVAVGLTLFPMLFSVPPAVDTAIELAQWGIIGWFAVEFVVAFLSAEDKRRFLTSPWRWLDLATIVIALASLLPSASAALRSSPILRLARIGRLLSLGVRASGVSTRQRTLRPADTHARGPVQVTLVADDPEIAPQSAELSALLHWLRAPDEQWFHVSSPGASELEQIETAAKLPHGYLQTHLHATSYPHWAESDKITDLFVWVPGAGDGLPFVSRMIAVVLNRVIRGNEQLAGRCEQRLRELEEVPIEESRPAFFELTFRLKKQLSAAQADLWRLKGIAAELGNGRRDFVELPPAALARIQRFKSDVDYLYDTLANIREEVLSIIDLHLNVVSFGMNRVMRVLAVISALGLIPAVVGGLLGMNLIDNPWPVTLPQIAFAVLFAMVLGLYFFIVKGWLR